MTYILSIETADTGCSVAIHKAGVLVGKKEAYEGKSSSGGLTLLIEACAQEAQIAYSDLAAIAVSKGPGSYTGLRIGVSTAKGMCFGLEIPLIGIDSLETLALVHKVTEADLICPMLDARRLEVYCKLLDSETFGVFAETTSLVLNTSTFQKELLSHKIFFCGPGSKKARPFLEGNNAIFSEDISGPHAEYMGAKAFELFEKNKFEDLIEFEPFYLKDFMMKKSKKKMPLDEV